jgi:hypothetical protein
MRVNTESREVLKSAKAEGYLHEVLLDRRSKMKSDRMCKWTSKTMCLWLLIFNIDVIKWDFKKY